MAKIEITIDDEQIEALSERDGLAKLLQPVLNQILDAEMTKRRFDEVEIFVGFRGVPNGRIRSKMVLRFKQVAYGCFYRWPMVTLGSTVAAIAWP